MCIVLLPSILGYSPPHLPMITHKDENKLNNKVENLELYDRKHIVNYGTGIARYAMEKQKR